MQTKRFKIYRLGASLGIALAQAITTHQRRFGPPAAIVVNPTRLAAAVQALPPGAPVTSSGGCLAWEVWLSLPQEAAQ